VLMVWIGVHPNTFLRKMTPSVQQLLTTVQNRSVMLADVECGGHAAALDAAGQRRHGRRTPDRDCR